MTHAAMLEAVELYEAMGRTHMPISLTEWREYLMATKTIGKATVKTDAAGKTKLSVPDTTPKHFKMAKRAKATRKAKGLVKNRDSKR